MPDGHCGEWAQKKSIIELLNFVNLKAGIDPKVT